MTPNADVHILCVDDEPFNLDILEESLSDQGYGLHFAENGQQALDLLFDESLTFSAVLLDRMMPDLDGLDVLKKAKKQKRLDGLPFIMQTAKATKSDICDGLHAGAYYYLTKPFDQKQLTAIVQTAVTDYQRVQEMRASLDQNSAVLKKLHEGTFMFKTLDEARELASVLANATDSPSSVVLGLTELLINAVEHGNLAITYDEKTALINAGNDAFDAEVDRRLIMAPYASKEASISLKRTNESVQFTIQDEGDGFEWSKYMEFDPSRAFHNHGRGVLIAKELAFDELIYQGNGNCVVDSISTKQCY